MDKQELIKSLEVRITINRSEIANNVNLARKEKSLRSVYTDLIEWHEGKVSAYETMLEMIQEDSQ